MPCAYGEVVLSYYSTDPNKIWQIYSLIIDVINRLILNFLYSSLLQNGEYTFEAEIGNPVILFQNSISPFLHWQGI